MRPSKRNKRCGDLFKERLAAIIDMNHSLVRLSGLMPWDEFDAEFGRHYRPLGRPAKPTRLMAGLHFLKHMYDLSDEETVERWVENPYWQSFCGFEFFQHQFPIDPSTMTRWRKRIGPEGMEKLLSATVGVAIESGTIKKSSLERVLVDTTVQPKPLPIPPIAVFITRPCSFWCARPRGPASSCVAAIPELPKRGLDGGPLCHAKQFKRMRRTQKLKTIWAGSIATSPARSQATKVLSTGSPVCWDWWSGFWPRPPRTKQDLFHACAGSGLYCQGQGANTLRVRGQGWHCHDQSGRIGSCGEGF
ncbi:transposase IS4 [Roseibium sp. TrichSKD4]|nr:transposase IS4 [Roseibium sp. TrichSKD4]